MGYNKPKLIIIAKTLFYVKHNEAKKLVCKYTYKIYEALCLSNMMDAFSNSVYFIVHLPYVRVSQSWQYWHVGQTILCYGGCQMNSMFSSIPGFSPLDANSIHPSHDDQNVPRHTKCHQGAKLPLGKSHSTRQNDKHYESTEPIRTSYQPESLKKTKNWFHLHPSSHWTKSKQSIMLEIVSFL